MQEPTISPDLLDLRSITIVHRFTSPEWLRTLKAHLAAAYSDFLDKESVTRDERHLEKGRNANAATLPRQRLYNDIVKLRVGEVLLFASIALVGLEMKRLGARYLKIKVRSRLTADGGKSIMAS